MLSVVGHDLRPRARSAAGPRAAISATKYAPTTTFARPRAAAAGHPVRCAADRARPLTCRRGEVDVGRGDARRRRRRHAAEQPGQPRVRARARGPPPGRAAAAATRRVGTPSSRRGDDVVIREQHQQLDAEQAIEVHQAVVSRLVRRAHCTARGVGGQGGAAERRGGRGPRAGDQQLAPGLGLAGGFHSAAVTNGDGAGTRPSVNRRIAMCWASLARIVAAAARTGAGFRRGIACR